MIDVIRNRRTIRKYSSEDIDEALLKEVLEVGCRAPTTGNMQVYSVIITRDKEMKENLLPHHFHQKMLTEAPVVLTFCADFNRFNKWCQFRKAEPGYDNFLSFFTAAMDAIIFAQTVCIVAEAKGLGTCYIGTTIYMAHEIIKTLKLPKGVVPVATITIGWPAETPEQVDRLSLDAIIHNEIYTDYNKEIIDKIYSEKEKRKDMQQFVKENNKKTLAQVFTDVRYKKEDNVHFSKILLQVLKDQEFMNQ